MTDFEKRTLADGRAVERYLLLLADTLRLPDEIWQVVEKRERGRLCVRRRYVARWFLPGEEVPALTVFEWGRDMWQPITAFQPDEGRLPRTPWQVGRETLGAPRCLMRPASRPHPPAALRRRKRHARQAAEGVISIAYPARASNRAASCACVSGRHTGAILEDLIEAVGATGCATPAVALRFEGSNGRCLWIVEVRSGRRMRCASRYPRRLGGA